MSGKTFWGLLLALGTLTVLSRAASTSSKDADWHGQALLMCEDNEREGGIQNLTSRGAGRRDSMGGPRCPAPTISLTFVEGKLQRKKYDKILRGDMKDDKVFRFILFYYPLCGYSRQMYSKVNTMGYIFHDKAEFYTVGVSGNEDSQRYPLMFKSVKSVSFQYVPVAYLFRGKKMIFKIDGDVDAAYLFNKLKAGLRISKAEAKKLMNVAEVESMLNESFAYLDGVAEEMEMGSFMFVVLSYAYVIWEVCHFVYKHFIKKTPEGANEDGNNNNNNNGDGDGQQNDNDEVAQLFIEQQQ